MMVAACKPSGAMHDGGLASCKPNSGAVVVVEAAGKPSEVMQDGGGDELAICKSNKVVVMVEATCKSSDVMHDDGLTNHPHNNSVVVADAVGGPSGVVQSDASHVGEFRNDVRMPDAVPTHADVFLKLATCPLTAIADLDEDVVLALAHLQSGVAVDLRVRTASQKTTAPHKAWRRRDNRWFKRYVLPALTPIPGGKASPVLARTRWPPGSRNRRKHHVSPPSDHHSTRGLARRSTPMRQIQTTVKPVFPSPTTRTELETALPCIPSVGPLSNSRTERSFTRRFVRQYRKQWIPTQQDTGTGSQKRLLPQLVTRHNPHGWNKTQSIVDARRRHSDPFGSTTTVPGHRHTCLIKSLQHLGVPIEETCDGPFRALADGNPMLRSHGLMLVPMGSVPPTVGRYIRWSGNHFDGIHLGSRGELGRALLSSPTDSMWFRLVGSTQCGALLRPVALAHRDPPGTL